MAETSSKSSSHNEVRPHRAHHHPMVFGPAGADSASQRGGAVLSSSFDGAGAGAAVGGASLGPAVPVESPVGNTPHTGQRDQFPALTAENLRQISEFDIAAYTKDEFTKAMETNVMRRCFAAFDVLERGTLGRAELRKLFAYLGEANQPTDPKSARMWEELFAFESIDFDTFMRWWDEYSHVSKKAVDQFAVVYADFSVQFHEQQLLTEETGELYTNGYRLYFKIRDCETGQVTPISPWHDIPLAPKTTLRTLPASDTANCFNFICEIPKWTRAKFEISTTEPMNPIKQDVKNGVPRFYKHGDMMFNYGAFPQTWESTEVQFVPGTYGDNDPLDGIEIGMTQFKTGSVHPVKVLGILGMIDDGQMDWKVICIAREDPIARFLEDIEDVPRFLPGCLDALREWLRVYKICQGGQENIFAFNGEYKGRDFALRVMSEAHRMWNNLLKVNGRRHFGAGGGGNTSPTKAS